MSDKKLAAKKAAEGLAALGLAWKEPKEFIKKNSGVVAVTFAGLVILIISKFTDNRFTAGIAGFLIGSAWLYFFLIKPVFVGAGISGATPPGKTPGDSGGKGSDTTDRTPPQSEGPNPPATSKTPMIDRALQHFIEDEKSWFWKRRFFMGKTYDTLIDDLIDICKDYSEERRKKIDTLLAPIAKKLPDGMYDGVTRELDALKAAKGIVSEEAAVIAQNAGELP